MLVPSLRDELAVPVPADRRPGRTWQRAAAVAEEAVLAVAAQLDRDCIRDKTLDGQKAAAPRGRHGGRPVAIDRDGRIYARALAATDAT
jgi:DNA invertase Pin-like site-specific DNA recombinase